VGSLLQMAAAALVALAAVSAAAGWYALGALVLAALFTLGQNRLSRMVQEQPEGPRWFADGAAVAVGVGRLALPAAAFGVYLFPAHRVAAGLVLVALVLAADLLGIRNTTYHRRWLVGVMVATTAVFLAVCLAIAPVPTMTTGHDASGTPTLVAGLRALGLAVVPLAAVPLGTGTRATRYLPFVGAVIGLIVVTAAALYQLGATRFGLSPSSLRTVFVAAEARTLLPVLMVTVVVVSVPAALDGIQQARLPLGGRRILSRALTATPCAVFACALVVILDPMEVLLSCAALLLGHTLTLGVMVLLSRRSALAVVMVVVAAGVLSTLPAFSLFTGVVLVTGTMCGVWLGQRTRSRH